jgi:hypothetical protein
VIPRWTLAAYVAIAIAIFAPALTGWFVADDWDFLILVANADSIAVCFDPLVGRFIRPLVMLTYYGNFHVFGLWPLPYHVTVVLIHAVSAWLVTGLAARLGLSRTSAIGAGLVFLVFGGHAEAVTWVAGAADPWLALFLLAGLLCFARALESDRPAGLMAIACVLFAGGLLAKETAVTAPALTAAFGAAALLSPAGAARARSIVTRTAIVTAATAAIAFVYLAVRARVFGSVLGAYEQLGTSQGAMAGEARKFVLRSFLPAGRWTAGLWLHHYDWILLAAAALVIAWILARRPHARAGLVFLIGAFAVSLAPAVPLTISLVNTVSERYVYVPTVFSCLLLALVVDALAGRRRRLAAAALFLVVLVHARSLVLANRTWIEASRLARMVMDEIIAVVRESPPSTETIVLNVPDTAAGAFVIRGAFLNSFHLMAPDVAQPGRRALMVASSAMASARDEVNVARLDDRRVSVELAEGGAFVQPVPPVTPGYGFDTWGPTRYVIAFNETRHRRNLLYTSAGHVRALGAIDAPPFGALDIPSDGTACASESIRFSGWALDDEEDAEVVLEREGPGGARVPIGAATRRAGSRPDVAAAYPDFPDARRAEWNYLLACALVRSSGGRLVVHAVAIDRGGQRRELGAVTLVSRPSP